MDAGPEGIFCYYFLFQSLILSFCHLTHIDIGSPDPERMSPINITKYVEEVAFKGVENVKISVIDDLEVIKKEYPLAHAVTRASLAGMYSQPRLISHFGIAHIKVFSI